MPRRAPRAFELYAIFRACGRVHRLLDMREFWIDASANTSMNKLSHNSCSPTVDSTIFQSTFTPQTIRQNASRDEQQQVQISRRQGRQPAGRGRQESTRPGSQGRCLQGGDEKVTTLVLSGVAVNKLEHDVGRLAASARQTLAFVPTLYRR